LPENRRIDRRLGRVTNRANGAGTRRDALLIARLERVAGKKDGTAW
jgi:hypothetical protein